MKTNIILLLFLASTYCGYSQERLVPYLHLSPLEEVSIPIGLVQCEITYSRPSMRGRKVFGGLVPFDTLWRAGANKNTKLTFDDEVIIGNQTLKKGSYTFFILPHPDSWTIYFYKYIDYYGIPKSIDTIEVILEQVYPVRTTDYLEETMSVAYQNIEHNSAELCITWERSQVRIPIQIPLLKNIEEQLDIQQTNLSSDYASAAQILYNREQDLEKSLMFINESITLLEDDLGFDSWIAELRSDDLSLPWRYHILSKIYGDQQKWKEAIAAAKRSNRIAEIVGSSYYPRENNQNIALWAKQ